MNIVMTAAQYQPSRPENDPAMMNELHPAAIGQALVNSAL